MLHDIGAMSPNVPDARKSFMDKAKHLMEDGRWPGLQLAMDAVILTSKGDDPSTKKVLMTAHRMRGHALGRMSRFDEALTDLQEALELSKTLGDQQSEAMCLGDLGDVSWNMGNNDLAMDFYKSALDLSKELGDNTTRAQVVIGLSNTRLVQGKLDEAISGFHTAIDILSPLEPSGALTRAYNNLGEALIKQGKSEEAFLPLEKAVDIAEKLGNIMARGFSRTNLALCYAYKGDLAKAKALVDLAIIDLGKAHDQAGLVYATCALGMIFALEKKYDIALQEIRKAESMAMRDGLDAVKGDVLIQKARVLSKIESGFSARTAYSEAIDLLTRLGNTKVAKDLEQEMTKMSLPR
jgi:tetratricopeptide (TPR) repeat protein